MVQLQVEIHDCEFRIATKKYHAIKEEVCFTKPSEIVRNKDLNIKDWGSVNLGQSVHQTSTSTSTFYCLHQVALKSGRLHYTQNDLATNAGRNRARCPSQAVLAVLRLKLICLSSEVQRFATFNLISNGFFSTTIYVF